MKTPKEWLELRTEVLHDGGDADLYKWISTIQKEAFECGCMAVTKQLDSGLEAIMILSEKTNRPLHSIAETCRDMLHLDASPTKLECCATDQCKVNTE